MATTPTTLQSLLTLLRQRTNTENNAFVSDAELTSYLNADLAVLDGILISKFSNYKITQVLVSVTAGTNYLALPSDFLKLRGLDLWLNNGQADGYVGVAECPWEHRNKRLYPSNGPYLISPYHYEYLLEGQNIAIIPPQTANSYQYRLSYVPDYVPLVNTTDTLQPYMDSQAWSEYAICASAAKVQIKQDLDPTPFQMQAEQMKNHIITISAPNRNASEPKAITNSRGMPGLGYYGWDW